MARWDIIRVRVASFRHRSSCQVLSAPVARRYCRLGAYQTELLSAVGDQHAPVTERFVAQVDVGLFTGGRAEIPENEELGKGQVAGSDRDRNVVHFVTRMPQPI